MSSRKIRLGLALALAAGLSSCRAGTSVAPLQEMESTGRAEFSLRVGESRKLPDRGVEVGFVRVSGDSRCPSDVVCVWAGAAGVQLWVRPLRGSAREVVTLTMPGMATRVDDVFQDVDGVRVALLGLLPYPTAGTNIPPDAYRATLRVTRTSS